MGGGGQGQTARKRRWIGSSVAVRHTIWWMKVWEVSMWCRQDADRTGLNVPVTSADGAIERGRGGAGGQKGDIRAGDSDRTGERMEYYTLPHWLK